MLEQESDFLVYLEKCPYIIKVEGFETDEDSAMMLTQYANGGDLYNYINLKNESGQKITIKEFDNLFRQLIVAVNCSLGKVLEFLFKLLVKNVSVYYVETEELIKKMLDKDPKTRISLHQAIETYNSFSAKKIEVVKNEDEQDDFIVVFKAKKSIKNKRKSPQKNHSKIKKSKKLI